MNRGMFKSLLAVSALVFILPASSVFGLSDQREARDTSFVINADGSGDFTTLNDAADFLEVYSGFTSDTIFYIASDLVESEPVVFERSALAKLIIKPLGEPRTIKVLSQSEFSYTGALAGFAVNWPTRLSSNQGLNVLIDGTLSGHEQGLTFSFEHDPLTTSTYKPHHGFAIGGYGSFEIRNCRIELKPETSHHSYAVLVETKVTGAVKLINNVIEAQTEGGCGLLVHAFSDEPGAAELVVSGNSITAATHGISVYGRDAAISDNQINITAIPALLDSLVGIVVNRYWSETTATIIARNKIVIKGGEDSMVAQGVRAVSQEDHPGSLRIYNNMISLNLDTGVESRAVRGITSVYRRGAVAEIAHNSIFLPGNQINNEETSRNFHGLGVDAKSSHTIVLANNMIRVGSKWGSALFYDDGNPIESNGNVIGISGDAVAVTTGETTHTLLGGWQSASGLDAESQTFDPLPVWGSPEDLHLVHSTAGLEPGVVGVLQEPLGLDIDGDVRSATRPTPGADEAALGADVKWWSLYGDSIE